MLTPQLVCFQREVARAQPVKCILTRELVCIRSRKARACYNESVA